MNQIINFSLEWLNNVGQWFWNYSAGMFIQVSLLIILLLLIDFLLRKRVRAVFRYCVWMLVFVKLILPPTLSLPTGIGYWYGDYLSANSPVLQQVSNVVRPEPVMVPTPENFAPSTEVPQIQPSQTNSETVAPVTSAVSGLNALTWQAFVFLLWLVGVLVISVLLIQRMLFVKGLIAQSEPAKNRLPDMLNQCRRQVGIGRNIELRLSNNISSPAVCGLFKPVILIPAALVEKLSPDRLRAVLFHELVNIKRADIWVNLVQTVLQIIYFYNPFVWLANAVVRKVREQAVDEMVLVSLGAGAKDYSNTLIDIAEMAFWKTSLSLRLIGVVESKKALHRRIRHMLNRPMPKRAKLGILGLLVVIIAGAILLPMAKGSWGQKGRIDKLVEKLNSKDDAVWKPAAEQLKKIGPKVARQVAELFRTATGDLHAIRVLKSMATDKHVQDVMVQGLSADPHSSVRHCSLIILSKSGNRGHVKRIIPLLRKDVENGENYSMAAIALAELGGDDAYNALVETVTKDIPDQMRWMIADGLVRVGRAEAVPYLKDALKLVDPSHPSAGARVVEAIHRLENKNGIVEKPYPNSLYTFTLREFDSGYSQRGILYAYDLQRADNASAYFDKPPAGANAEETMSGNLRALAAGSKGDLIFERVGEQTRLQAYHGTLLAPLEVKTEPPHHYWTDAVGKMLQSELKQLVLDYNNKRAKDIAGPIPGFRLYPFDEGDLFAAVLPSGQIAILATKKIESYTSGVRLSVLYLDPLLALVGTGRIEASQDSTADADKSHFIATMPNGVTVELVGICEHPSEGKQWWRPDGTTLENSQYPYRKSGKIVRTGIKDDKILELALRFPNLPEKKIGITCDAVDSGFGNYEKDIWATTIQVPREQDKLDIKFGIAAGLWTTVERSTGNGVQASSGSGGAFTFAKPYESNSSVGITVTHNKNSRKLNYRIVAVDNNSVTHTSSSSTSSGISTWTQTTVHFTNLTLEQIKEFRFQTRPYQWVTFKNVSLRPGIKTDVQVEAKNRKETLAIKKNKVYLPDLETPDANVVLDFATGQMLSAEKMENDRHYFDKSGKGDLAYEYASGQSGLLCLRGARMQMRTADGLSSLKPDVQRSNFIVYVIRKVPCQYQITTAEGNKYELKVFSVDKGDKGGAHIEHWKSGK